MTVVGTNPQRILGHWQSGIALDFHTTSSTPIGESMAGHMQFDTVRPPIAQLLYRLKYRQDSSAATDIIETAASLLRPHLGKFDLIVPVPASNPRPIQPVQLLARGIGAALGISVADCVTTTRATTQLKGVTDATERMKLVQGLYGVDPTQTEGRNILLFDDLFRSGTTMNAVCDVLLGTGKGASVRALAITKARNS